MPVKTINWQGQDKRIDVDWHLKELDRIDCEESLTKFLMHAWRFIDPAPFKSGWVIDALAEHLEAVCDGDIRRLLINIPPRMAKSSICSVAFPAWVWAQSHDSPTSGPTVPFLHASYGYNLSLRDSVKCRRLIKSTWYQRLWGNRVQITNEQDQKIRFQNTRGGERLITSIGSGVTGEGGNLILVDDPNAADEVLSDATIKSTNEDWWDGTMGTRLNDAKTGAFVVIQQRLGENDLSGHILSREADDWTHLMLPMHYEATRSFSTSIGWKDPRKHEGELLWPERFGEAEVASLERRLGKWKAAGQLEQRPEPQGGGIVKRDWWQLWPPEGEPKDKNGHILKAAAFPPFSYILASLDTAYTEDTRNDPSALEIWGVFNGDVIAQEVKVSPTESTRVYTETSTRVMLAHAWTDRLEINDLVNLVGIECQDHEVDKLLIESKASGISVAQELRRLLSGSDFKYTDKETGKVRTSRRPRHTFAIQLIDPKSISKMARLYSVQHLFEEGTIFAPDRKWADQVITQVGTFPNGAHDDLVDCTSMALKHMREIGLLQRTTEITSDVTEGMVHRGRPLKRLYPA
jgi:predicted phage terminase large subunit-like protein